MTREGGDDAIRQGQARALCCLEININSFVNVHRGFMSASPRSNITLL